VGWTWPYPPVTRAPRVRRTIGTPVERRDVLGGLIHEYRWAARFRLLNPSRPIWPNPLGLRPHRCRGIRRDHTTVRGSNSRGSQSPQVRGT
jgi:hypothetical protein